MQKYRIISFVLVHLLIFIHVLWFQNSFLGSFDFQEFFDRFIGYGILNAGSVLVILAFFTTLIFGRFFCGWLCHFGAVQEFAWWIFNKMGIKPKTINSRLITFLPLFILFNFYIIPNLSQALYGDESWNLSLNLSYPKIWAFLPGVVVGSLTFIIDGFLIVYFLGRKGFCRFVCPWGAFLKLPTSLSTFKVRKTGDCTHCNECTSHCPTGIDVSYEINKFDRVIHSNCTSCMLCIDGCPEEALSYKFKNPISDFEKISLSDFKFSKKSFIHAKIKDQFIYLRNKDIYIIPFAILFGLLLDGLYGMGHMLSFGISVIISLVSFNKKISLKTRYFILFSAFIVMCFNGQLKYSRLMAVNFYETQQFKKAIPYFEYIVQYYPVNIGKYHAYLGVCYFKNNNFNKSVYHYNKAYSIIPDNDNVKKLKILLDKGYKY